MSTVTLNPDVLSFYAELRENNTKKWWTANKRRYDENVAEPFTALGDRLSGEFGPMKVFRPYRDVRFGPDKSPYKLHIGMVSRSAVASYLQLGETGLMVGGGIYMVPTAALARFRELVDDPRRVRGLTEVVDKVVREGFSLMRDDALRTAPRGYPSDHPQVALLQLRRLAVAREVGTPDWLWTPEAVERIRVQLRAVAIWCDWLRANLGDVVD